MLRKIAPAILLLLAAASASATVVTSVWSTGTGASNATGPVSATVSFSLGICSAGSCSLNIDVTNNQANPTGAGQLVSDLDFVLMNGSTALSGGTLQSSTSNGSGAVGLAGTVVVLDSHFNKSYTSTLPGTWKLSNTGGGGFFLNDLTGATPQYMIIGPGPYTNANSSITGNHAPSLAGTVRFTVTDIAGLSPTTSLSNVVFSFGTGPDSFSPGLNGGGGGGGGGQATPEPLTFGLVGGGLIGIYFIRRRPRVSKG